MLSIRLDENMEKEIKKVAEFEGMSVSDFVRKIISEKLEDMYDLKVGEEALERFEKGNQKTYTHDEVFNR